MVDELLTTAGVQHRQNRFVKPPAETYALWMDDISTDGPDCAPTSIFTHDITIELYEYTPDAEAEAAIESAMSEKGLRWTKQDRYWIEVEQLYQVIYEFSYIEKRRK